MSENRRSEGQLVTLQFCTAASNIPAGTPLGVGTGSNSIYTLGINTTGAAMTANAGGTFIGISDQDVSAGQTLFSVWVKGVFELTAASAWTTATIGVPIMADSGRVCINAANLSGQAPIGTYIPAGAGERSGRTILVNINPVMWRWATYNVASDATSGGICGDSFPRAL